MLKNKKYIIIGSLILLISIGGFSYSNLIKEKDSSVINQVAQNQTKTNLNINKKAEIPIEEKEKKEIPQKTPDKNSIQVSLTVVDKKYETHIKENSSVFEAMENIKNESTGNNIFDFKYTNNESLGNFVTEINGQYGTPGKYWIYYVNDKKASVGVSNYILKEGDIIKWSQEGM